MVQLKALLLPWPCREQKGERHPRQDKTRLCQNCSWGEKRRGGEGRGAWTTPVVVQSPNICSPPPMVALSPTPPHFPFFSHCPFCSFLCRWVALGPPLNCSLPSGQIAAGSDQGGLLLPRCCQVSPPAAFQQVVAAGGGGGCTISLVISDRLNMSLVR